MSKEATGNGLLVLGTMLLGYTLATGNAITGSFVFDNGDPRLRFHWIMLSVSLTIIVVALFILFIKKGDETRGQLESDLFPSQNAADLSSLMRQN